MLVEHEYRYPRFITWPLELICGIIVGWNALNLARAGLLLLWKSYPLDPFILHRVPQFQELIDWLQKTGPRTITMRGLLPALVWLLAVLFATLVVRNAFPPVRFSIRGLLVWFGNDWAPIQWEGVRALRITEAPDGKRFVLLAQTDDKQLTPYHRLYSFLFRFGFARGVLISSAMSDGEGLLREILDEVKRRRKLGEKLEIKVDEHAFSPLFSLLLSPTALFGRRRASNTPVFQPVATAATMRSAAALTMPSMGGSAALTNPAPSAVAPQAAIGGETIAATYPRIVTLTLNALTVLIAGFAVWRYLEAWRIFLRYTFTSLADVPFFDVQVSVVSPWGLLIGAHVGLLLVGVVVLMLRHLFPDVAVDSNGIVFTALGRSQRLAWEQVSFVKATDVRNEQHVILVEAEGKNLPWYYIMGSWLYDGGMGRGALIWPAMEPFEPLMQRLALELTRRQQPDQPLRLRDDAPGWLLMLAVRPADALDRLVLLHEQDTDMPQNLEMPAVLRAASRVAWCAAGPAVLLLIYWMMYKGLILSFQVPLMLILALLWGITEWPLASFLASSMDQVVGAGNKGYQGLYVYPTAQLPRLLPLLLAILLTLMGFPNLAMLAWVAGIAWSGLLTAGLWEALYGWRGMALLGGSFMTVFFQLLTFLGVLMLRG